MSKQETLNIFERDTTITPRQLRKIGYIPVTIYGKTLQPLSAQIKAYEFGMAIARGIKQFKLTGLGQSLDVEIKQLQRDNAKQTVMHVEFFLPQGAEKKAQVKAQPKADSAGEASAAEAEARTEEPVAAH